MPAEYWERFARRSLARRTLLRRAGLTGVGLAAAGFVACSSSNNNKGAKSTSTSAAAPTNAATAAPSSAATTAPAVTASGTAAAGTGTPAAFEPAPGGGLPYPSAAAPMPALGTPKPGGTYLIGDNVAATSHSPYHSGFEASLVRPLFQIYYDVLWLKLATGANPLQLELAESFEQVDPTHVTVKIKKGTVFHNKPPVNGREVTAEDIAKDIAFLLDPGGHANLNTAFIQGNLVGPPKVVDAYTLQFETKGPRTYFFDADQVAVSVVPKEILDENTLKQGTQIGSGPWQYKSEQQSSIYEAARFENYRVKGKPYLDGIKLTIIPDKAAQEAAFRSGQLLRYDFADIRNRDSVLRDLGKKIWVYSNQGVNNVGVILNMSKPLFQDVRVREAIWKSIDRDRLIKTIQFGDGTISGYFPAVYQDLALPLAEIQPFQQLDRKRAKQLLDAAGFPYDKEFVFPLPVESQYYVDSGRLISEDLAQLGIKTKLEPITRTLYIQRAGGYPGDFDISLWPLQGNNFPQQFRNFHSKEGSFQLSLSLHDPEIDALIEKSEQALDRQEWLKIGQQIQRQLFQKYANWIPTYTPNTHQGFYTAVRGLDKTYDFATSASGAHFYQRDLWLDKGA